jgi:hypothetical protein
VTVLCCLRYWPITRPEERLSILECRSVLSRNLSNEVALACVGLLPQTQTERERERERY